jgi:lipase
VFLHGLGVIGPRASDEPAEAWAALGFRVLAPDLPGFGSSRALSRDEYRPSRLARLLLEELPAERFALVGHSWGGTIGTHLTVLAPERVRALVLGDVGYRAPASEPPSYDDLLRNARAEFGANRFSDGASFLEFARAHFSERLSDEALLASLRDDGGALVPELTPEVFAAGMRGYHEEPPVALHDALRDTRIPILLLVAGQPADETRDAEVVAFQRALPDADVLRFPKAGHNVLLDAADEAIPAVGDWLLQRIN